MPSGLYLSLSSACSLEPLRLMAETKTETVNLDHLPAVNGNCFAPNLGGRKPDLVGPSAHINP